MTHHSLRLRLLAGAAVAIFAALAIAWAFMTFLFQRQLEQRVEQELRRDALQLIAGLSVDPAGTITVQQPPTDPRFETPASGLYWQVSGNGVTERSRSLWDDALAASPRAHALEWEARIADGPFGNRLFLIERLVTPTGGTMPVLVQLALDENELSRSRAEFSRTMALFLLLLWVVLSSAAWIQVQLGLRPLSRLRGELTALRHNAAERLSARYPQEVEPLTDAINDLASAREADVKRARQRAADLAHDGAVPAPSVGRSFERRMDPGPTRSPSAQPAARRTDGVAAQCGRAAERAISAGSRTTDERDQ